MKKFNKTLLATSLSAFLLCSNNSIFALDSNNITTMDYGNVHIAVIQDGNCADSEQISSIISQITENFTPGNNSGNQNGNNQGSNDNENNSQPDNQNPGQTIPDNNENQGSNDNINNNPDNQNPGQTVPDNSGNDQGDNSDVDSELQKLANEVVNLVNAQRAANGLGTLQIDLNVQSAAQIRAEEINNVFSHTRPNGTSCFTALQEVGVSYRGAGENIASGQTSAQQVMDAWMNSEGHRANILNSNFTKIGVGVYKSSAGRYCWTQMFTY